MLFGSITIWVALLALLTSCGCYLFGGPRLVKWGRAAFVLAAVAVLAAAATLGTLLVTHRFDVAYVYEHSARGMEPLYWFPSFWSGQEGSFLLWAFWSSLLGVVLACTSGKAERRVMPIYSCVLIFLMVILLIRSPFVPLDTQGMPVPTDGLGLNPNLENYWMTIHPPTLFLGFSALNAPWALALAALFWREARDNWMRRAVPWGLFGFAVLGLAMMMGGYWAYEMLGWGGFWGWDPVENGPLVPWLALIGFLHAAQIQRVRGGFGGWTRFFALLPFLMALYETFLTRTGVLDKFSVHSFSTLGGIANDVLLYGLLLATVVSLGLLLARSRSLPKGESAWDAPLSREFGYRAAIILVMLVALISAIGMSVPLLTGIAVKFHWMAHTASVKEDFFNKANFPLAVLLAIGMGIGPALAWKGRGLAESSRLVWSYGLAVLATVIFVAVGRITGIIAFGPKLVPQLLLFAASVFALISNLILWRRLTPTKDRPAAPWTIGGLLSHVGVAVFLIGVVCLVTFYQKDPDVMLIKGRPASALGGQYTMTYIGQTSDYQTDKNNALKFDVVSKDGKEHFIAKLPFALRAVEGGQKMLFGHPAIVHHAGGDLYIALKDGPDEFYKTPVYKSTIGLGHTQVIGDYALQFVRFDRDPTAAAFVQATGQMPANFPVTAVLRVTYRGQTHLVKALNIMHRDNPSMPDTPEVTLPGGWLVSFQGMNAGSANMADHAAGGSGEGGNFAVRQDSGPPLETFQLEVSTRPMISLVWLGTLLLVAGGLIGMRRRILENRAIPIVDEDAPAAPVSTRTGRRRAGTRVTTAKPAPSLAESRRRGG